MLRSFVFVLFLTAGLWLKAQKPAAAGNEYAKLDASALLLPDSLTSSTDKIAGYINAHFGPAVEKTRAVFIWVANNIQYDVDNTALNKSIDDLTTRVVELQEWLKKYFSKGKTGRKSMFRKYTWFGLPLN